MDMREALTMRTATALQRLADLEERGRTLAGPKATVLKTALRELEAALEELRVASEQLHETVDEMTQTRMNAHNAESRFTEFRNLLPVATLITDRQGQIVDANAAAGELLNVAPRHLAGKPLSLYMADRDRFFSLLNGVRLAGDIARGELGVRPRERKLRMMSIQASQVGSLDEVYWFLQEPAGAVAA